MTVSKRHSTMGYPLQEGYEWEIDGSTLPITFLYNNGKTTIDHSTVNFYVKNDTKNGPKEKVTVSIGQRRNWVATKYYISEPGNTRFQFRYCEESMRSSRPPNSQ